MRLKFGVKWGNPGSCKGAAEIWCEMGEIQASVRVRLKFGVKWGKYRLVKRYCTVQLTVFSDCSA